jgi:hypothetical protein
MTMTKSVKAREARINRYLKTCELYLFKGRPDDPDDPDCGPYAFESTDPNERFRRLRRGHPPVCTWTLERIEKHLRKLHLTPRRRGTPADKRPRRAT